jgi:hypothetical protein
MTGEGRISVRWMKSLAHCSTRVAIRAQDRLSPRLRNQRVLHARDAVDGVNAELSVAADLVLDPGSSWVEICARIAMVIAP